MCIWGVADGERHCDVCAYLGGCEVREKVETVSEAGGRYVEVMSGLVGRDIRERVRFREVVWARNIVFYRLLCDGFTEHAVGRYMGYDHATVHHGKVQVRMMLDNPEYFKEESRLWESFLNSL